jgi:uncharacterized integral membrane protein
MTRSAIGYGALTGGAVGLLVMLGFAAADTTEYALADLAGVLVVYLPLAFLVGAVAGLVEALVALGAVLALRGFVAGRTGRVCAVAGLAAAAPGLLALTRGATPVVALGFAVVCAAGAALWAPRVVRAGR